MKICVCLDKKIGMMFFGKRQSQDAVQRERFLSLVGNNKLWMSDYSAKLFGDLPNIVVDENYSANAGADDYCFVEDQSFDISKCSTVVIYKWNRQYQADKSFTVNLKAEGFKKISTHNFAGSSHDKITEEIYERVWNEKAINTDTIMVHVRNIRDKIEINPREPKYLKVVWGVGYKIEKQP